MTEGSNTLEQLLRDRMRLDEELARHQQLVTVMFVDIVGSTRFYEQHGDVAGLTMVQKFLDALVPLIQEYGGVVVKTIGDAILARFENAEQAVRCALNLQWTLLASNDAGKAAEPMRIRVALNSGLTLVKDGDVFGDVVNVASRIETAARPGDILISPSVYDQVRLTEGVAVRLRAEGAELKGRAERLDLYEVVWRYGEPVGPQPARPSVEQLELAAGLPPAAGRSRRTTAIVLGFVALAVLLVVSFQARRRSRETLPSRAMPVAVHRVSTGGAASTVTEANEYFEKGMLFLRAQYDLPRAREMLERALALDPHFAEARGWHGFSDVLMVDSGYSNDGSWLYKAEEEAHRALQDDPNSARAHSALAAAYVYQGRKELAPAEIEKALAANRADLDAQIWLLNYHLLEGNYEAAQAVAKQMLDLDPLFFPARMNLGDILRDQGNAADAVRQFEKILEADVHNNYAITKLARVYMDAGDLPKARRTLELGHPEDRKRYETRLAWALLFALEGKKAAAEKEMDSSLEKYAEVAIFSTLPVADFYSIRGDTAKSLEWLERAVRNGDERVEWFRRDPLLANVRRHPRFQQIVESTAYRRQQRRSSGRAHVGAPS